MIYIRTLTILLATFLFTMCSAESPKLVEIENVKLEKDLTKYEIAYFAAGCFWCVEAVFESVRGVEEAVSGYSGGVEQNPTYKQVSAGKTGHTEAVKIYYDPQVVSYNTLVKVFYGSHNPTTVNGQHPDYGMQYRSAIFYQSEEERLIIEDYISKLEKSRLFDEPIATEVLKYKKFWKAEYYHQNYEKLNPEQSYIKNVSIPRLRKFQNLHKELLKESVLKYL